MPWRFTKGMFDSRNQNEVILEIFMIEVVAAVVVVVVVAGVVVVVVVVDVFFSHHHICMYLHYCCFSTICRNIVYILNLP